MHWIEERAARLREFFKLAESAELITHDEAKFELRAEEDEGLAHFNIEWHIIPSAQAVALDDAYISRLYPMATRDFSKAHEPKLSYRDRLIEGHKKHQGRVIGIETTAKPHYLPHNRQFYGTTYGHDASADPFAAYMGRAGMMNGTRYDHNYLSLRAFVSVVNEDWRARSILPEGYRVTVCPPAVFNLIGTVFHTEWSETETLELGFYRDDEGNAICYAVGSNGPRDFSYLNEVEGDAEWSLMGFRVAVVPE
ncbi:MAG: hypothetical protein JOZ52_08045 [Acidobacteria bacterium]|nr:hypothetical protein [Acidobacteriota bacterium]